MTGLAESVIPAIARVARVRMARVYAGFAAALVCVTLAGCGPERVEYHKRQPGQEAGADSAPIARAVVCGAAAEVAKNELNAGSGCTRPGNAS